MPRTLCALAAVVALAPAALAVDYDELMMGDLSDDQFAPTDIGVLTTGSNTVTGSTTNAPLDRDFWTFTIAPGDELTGIVIDSFGPRENNSFIALVSGTEFTTIEDASGYLGATLIGNASFGAGVGDNVLPNIGQALLGGTGFTGSIGPGTYSLWFQETADVIDYSFDLRVVPAPGAAGLLAVGGLAAMRRRR